VCSSSSSFYSRRGWSDRSGISGEVFLFTFNALRPALVRALYLSLGNFEDAQDVAQEAFIKCWRSRDNLPRVRNLRAWIFRVGRNSAKDLQRSAFRRRSRPLSLEGVPLEAKSSSPQKTAEDRECQERLRRALLQLRTDEREVFLMRQNSCRTYEEIARIRGIPVGTIKSQMRSAIAKLHRVLREK
jgi:RNA polymerase sigma-70 factor, ECF subfamily